MIRVLNLSNKASNLIECLEDLKGSLNPHG